MTFDSDWCANLSSPVSVSTMPIDYDEAHEENYSHHLKLSSTRFLCLAMMSTLTVVVVVVVEYPHCHFHLNLQLYIRYSSNCSIQVVVVEVGITD